MYETKHHGIKLLENEDGTKSAFHVISYTTPDNQIIPRKTSLVNIQHPEWGTFGVYEDHGEYYSVYNRGHAIVWKSEIGKFWAVKR